MSALTDRRRLLHLRRRTAAALALAATALASATASAAEPRPVVNPAPAASLTVNGEVTQGGALTFSGTGWANAGHGNTVQILIDDRAILTSTGVGEWAVFTSGADGNLTGSLDLSRAHPDTPLLPGTSHWVRALTGTLSPADTPRSLIARFTVAAAPGAPDPNTPVVPGTPNPPASPSTPTTPTTPAATPEGPRLVQTGPVWLTAGIVKPTKSGKKVTLPLKAGALGSAGTVTVKSKSKVKVGKGKKTYRTLARSDAYFVDKLGSESLNVTLTADGRALVKKLGKGKDLKAIVRLTDANGEDSVKQEIWIRK